MRTKGGGGVENPENFADVLYVWSPMASSIQVKGQNDVTKRRLCDYVQPMEGRTFFDRNHDHAGDPIDRTFGNTVTIGYCETFDRLTILQRQNVDSTLSLAL